MADAAADRFGGPDAALEASGGGGSRRAPGRRGGWRTWRLPRERKAAAEAAHAALRRKGQREAAEAKAPKAAPLPAGALSGNPGRSPAPARIPGDPRNPDPGRTARPGIVRLRGIPAGGWRMSTKTKPTEADVIAAAAAVLAAGAELAAIRAALGPAESLAIIADALAAGTLAADPDAVEAARGLALIVLEATR